MSATPKIVNLTELAFIVDISSNSLGKLIRENRDTFPVESEGRNGVAYEFDVDKVKAWLADHKAKADEEKAARDAQVKLWRQEAFGSAAGDADADDGLPIAEKIKLTNLEFELDRLRKTRGELVEVQAVEAALSRALVELRTRLLRLPQEFAKAEALDPDATKRLVDRVDQILHDLADALGSEAFYDATGAAAPDQLAAAS